MKATDLPGRARRAGRADPRTARRRPALAPADAVTVRGVAAPRPQLEAPTGGFGSVALHLPEPVRRAVPAGVPAGPIAVVVGAGVTAGW